MTYSKPVPSMVSMVPPAVPPRLGEIVLMEVVLEARYW